MISIGDWWQLSYIFRNLGDGWFIFADLCTSVESMARGCRSSPLWKGWRDMRISQVTDFDLWISGRFLKSLATGFYLRDSRRFLKSMATDLTSDQSLGDFWDIRRQIWRPTGLQDVFEISNNRFGHYKSLHKFFKISGDD